MSTLKQLGANCNLKIGVATTKSALLYADPVFEPFVVRNCSLLCDASGLLWSVCHPEEDTYNFEAADWMLTFAKKNGMLLRGHTLCWNGGNPEWLTKIITPKNAEDLLVSHIKTVAGRYAGKLDSWNVVNEAITVWQGQPNGLSSGPWLKALGPEYIDLAFKTAAEVDPTAVRMINFHECEQAAETATRAASLALIESLLKRGVPLQCVGLESHIDIGVEIDYTAMAQFIRDIKSLGLGVEITEFDVNDAKQNGSYAVRDAAVADWYKIYLNFILGRGIVERITLWSPTDIGNWMDIVCKEGDPEFIRDDGSCDHRPGLLNTNWELSPAYSSISEALEAHALVAAVTPHGNFFTNGRN
jgi:endo-1,4-beta-xylanase